MIRISSFFFLFLLASCSFVYAELKVLVTVKPIHSLVAAVMGDSGEPALLIDGTQSPHGFHLKPSQARVLYGADLVFYIDEDFERFLKKPLKSDSMDGKSLALSQSEGIKIKNWHHEHEHHGHEAHECSARDLHLWLCIDNTLVMVDAIADKLSRMQSEYEAVYVANAETLKASIRELDEVLKAELTQVQGRPYLVFHDAYQYFETRYGLTNAGVISKQPGVPLSARQLRRIQGLIDEEGVVCVFGEPQFSDSTIRAITEETGLRRGELDPLGATLESGETLYFELMKQLAGDFTRGLQ